MSRSAAFISIEETIDALRLALGDDLLAVYLYGSLSDGTYQAGQSDVNLIAVHQSPTAIHRVRDALGGGFWAQHGSLLKQSPLLATPETLNRHLRINPLFYEHFTRSGQLLYGAAVTADLGVTSDRHEMLANATAQTMRATAALAPSLLPVKEAHEALASLRSIARRLFGWPVDADESPAVLAGRILGHLRQILDQESFELWPDHITPNAPPLIGELRAIYERDNHLILVMPDLEPVELARRIADTDWPQVAGRITDLYRGLRVTTPTLLRLVVTYEDSADYLVQSYHHAWGADLLGTLDISPASAYRALARIPSALELSGLPYAYIIAEDADLSMLIHDFQNKLLNIQLRSELLCRTMDIPASVPVESLPEIDTPNAVRIDAILGHLHWWADHYAELFRRAQAVV